MHSHWLGNGVNWIMALLEASLKESLRNTASSYRQQLLENDDAMAYWTNRGLSRRTIDRFGLGFVAEPAVPDDESFVGRLVIPYVAKSEVHGNSVVGFKFRAFKSNGPKYLYRTGLNPKLFNTAALQIPSRIICIAEGEVDAMSADQAGIPCVGIPGATYWEPFYSRLFSEYREVVLLQDNDPPNKNGKPTGGELMADLWTKKLKGIANLRVIQMAEDVNADMVAFGEDYLRELVGI